MAKGGFKWLAKFGDWVTNKILRPIGRSFEIVFWDSWGKGSEGFWTNKGNYWGKMSKWYGYYFRGEQSDKRKEEKKDSANYRIKAREIIQKYNLNISEYELMASSTRYADHKDKERYGEDVSGYVGNNVGDVLEKNIKLLSDRLNKSDKYSHQKDKIEEKKRFEEAQQKLTKEMKNEALTQILMKNPFAIFVNGALYKKGRPGSKTYDPLTVWEPYKYITGDIKEDEYNDILQNRSHYKLAGNKDYFAHVWDEPNWQMPDRSKTIRYRYDAYNHKIRMLNEGYKELQFLGWYAYYDINNKKPVLNYVQKLNDLYEKEIKAVPKPIYKKNTNQLAYSEGIFKKRKSALF